jgi:hypothetical protein
VSLGEESAPRLESNRGGSPCFFAPPIPHNVRRRHPKKNSVWKMRGVFLPPPISHHVHAQASGKIASRKIVCSCERVRRFLSAIFSVRHPRKKAQSPLSSPRGRARSATSIHRSFRAKHNNPSALRCRGRVAKKCEDQSPCGDERDTTSFFLHPHDSGLQDGIKAGGYHINNRELARKFCDLPL